MYRCTVIGISDAREQRFQPEVLQAIQAGKVFSGGKRHREIVADLLPQDYEWIDIAVPLDDVYRHYHAHDELVIFASGDPLFHGFAGTLRRLFPDVEMHVFPTFNSLQTLAHRLCMPYEEMHVVSLTGRPWDRFDEALINGEALIGCLTDRNHTPQAIWQRMQDYGYTNYTMTVGENLGNEASERLSHFTSSCPPRQEIRFDVPNCVILQRTAVRPRPFGLPEGEFALLNGRAKMITKMPIRLLSLSMLDLRSRHSLWDIGFCTGSVSIEAKLQFPLLHITAFEVREEGRALMQENSRRFGTPGITTVIGDFLQQDLTQYPPPDCVFIGGHGGHLREMIATLRSILLPGGCIVFNSVSDESRQLFLDAIAEAGLTLTASTQITIDSHNPIWVMKAESITSGHSG